MSAAAAELPLDECWTRAHPDHCTFVQGLVREVYKMLERTVPPLAQADSDEWNPLAEDEVKLLEAVGVSVRGRHPAWDALGSPHRSNFAQRRWGDGSVRSDMDSKEELMILACGRGIGDEKFLDLTQPPLHMVPYVTRSKKSKTDRKGRVACFDWTERYTDEGKGADMILVGGARGEKWGYPPTLKISDPKIYMTPSAHGDFTARRDRLHQADAWLSLIPMPLLEYVPDAEFRLALGNEWPGCPGNIHYVPTDKPYYCELLGAAASKDSTVLATEIDRIQGCANDVFLRILSTAEPSDSSTVVEKVWREVERRQLTSEQSVTRWNPRATEHELRARVAELERQLLARNNEITALQQSASQPVAAAAPPTIGFEDGPGYEALYRHQNNPGVPAKESYYPCTIQSRKLSVETYTILYSDELSPQAVEVPASSVRKMETRKRKPTKHPGRVNVDSSPVKRAIRGGVYK